MYFADYRVYKSNSFFLLCPSSAHMCSVAVWGGVLFFPDSHDVSMFTCLTLVMTFSSHSCSPSVINTRSLSSPKFQSICSLYGINPGVPPTPKTEPLFSDHTVCLCCFYV